MAFGEKLKKWREIRGVSQELLAEKVGCGRVTIARIETNKQSPTEETMRKLAEALNVPLPILLDNDNEEDTIGLDELYRNESPELVEFLKKSGAKSYLIFAKKLHEKNLTPDELEFLSKIIKG